MSNTREAIIIAIRRLLRPLIRILLRHGVAFSEFAEIAKGVYVDVAANDFRIEGRKQTVSRICVLTGMHRKDVNRLLEQIASEDTYIPSTSRGARVIAGWLSDEAYVNKAGRPIELNFDGERSFSELVKTYSGDMPARAMLDELKRTSLVEVTETGKLRLLSDAYVPEQTDEQMLELLGDAGHDLFNTIQHNLSHPKESSRLQLAVHYDQLTESEVEEFKQMAEKESLELLKKYNLWLSMRDSQKAQRSEQTDYHTGTGIRAGLGIYYIQDHESTIQDNESNDEQEK